MNSVAAIVIAPVVSADTTSPEAVLAREAKKIELQAHADSKYDDKEFFADYIASDNGIFRAAVYSAAFVAAVVFISKRK